MFLNACKHAFHISHMHISQKVKGVLMWKLQHIVFKTKIFADLQICISIPLNWKYTNCASDADRACFRGFPENLFPHLFRKLSANYYQSIWWSLFTVTLHAFSMFFWTMKSILYGASHFRHSNNIQTTKKPHPVCVKTLERNTLKMKAARFFK